MAKDPAMLFYTSDFLTGTMFMSNEQVGIYIRLLCALHQHGGMIDKVTFDSTVGNNAIVREKFVATEDGYYNKRLMEVMDRRSVKSTNLSANAKVRWNKEKQKQCNGNANEDAAHMPTETETETTTEDVKEKKIDTDLILAHWNTIATKNGLSTIIKVSDRRRSAILARMKEKEFDLAKIEFEIGQSEFLRGMKGDGWRCSFDFVFCSKDNYLKILEGKYRNGNPAKPHNPNSAAARATFKHGPEQIKNLEELQANLERRERDQRA